MCLAAPENADGRCVDRRRKRRSPTRTGCAEKAQGGAARRAPDIRPVRLCRLEAIAAEADVSTRTIYNQFDSKEQLFATVLVESSRQVAAAREALIQRYLTDVDDLETALVSLAREWVRPAPEFADHFAIVRRIRAEAVRAPEELRAAWLAEGPSRARRALADRLARLAEQGLLATENPDFAAAHFMALITDTTTSRSEFSATAQESEIDRFARAGVHAFLHGYLPRAP
jgi:AcrR family transcriptional regulator